MENKRIFAIIGIVVGMFWGLKILIGWNAYSELSSYSSGFFQAQVNEAFNALVIQSIIVAAILFYSAKNLNPSAISSTLEEPFASNVSNDLSSDAYKIYLTKKYKIEKNAALEKIICEDKLFATIEDALEYASNIDEQSKANEAIKKTTAGGFVGY